MAYLKAMKAVDPTIKIGVDFSSPIVDPIVLNWNPDLMKAVCASTTFDLAIIHYYPGTYRDVQASEMLSMPQSDFPRVISGIQQQLAQYCPANAANIQFFVTETSPNGTVDGGVPPPVIGLFALNVFMSGLQAGVSNIDWLELHGGSFLDNSETPGSAFYGIQLAHNAAAVGDQIVSASSNTNTVVAYAMLKANGQKGVILINADPAKPAQVQVNLAGTTLGSTATLYSYGVSTTQTGPALTSTTIAVNGNSATVSVPAYTAVELLIP